MLYQVPLYGRVLATYYSFYLFIIVVVVLIIIIIIITIFIVVCCCYLFLLYYSLGELGTRFLLILQHVPYNSQVHCQFPMPWP